MTRMRAICRPALTHDEVFYLHATLDVFRTLVALGRGQEAADVLRRGDGP